MICYNDKTYCASINCKNKCGRKLTDKIKQDAKLWWVNITTGQGREKDLPLHTKEFCDEWGEVKEQLNA
jgi:hypothetical protein